MATISADGQSFLVNNKRVWIAGGHAGYAGVPRALWRRRLRQVAEAGLNAVTIPVVWSAHERNPGKLSFEGDLDAAAFIRLAGELGLWVIVQAGPVVAGRFGMGGIPAHILSTLDTDTRLRTGDSGFLHAVSSFYSALSREIAPLQITRAGDHDPDARRAAPVIAVQTEHLWRCGHDALAATYLNGLTRYLREGGVNVPILNLNNMFAEGEGAIETWAGWSGLHAVTRQLRSAWPDEPAIIGEVQAVCPPVWGEKQQREKSPESVLRTLSAIIAGGGQFSIGDFAPALPRGFEAGRFTHAPDAWTSSAPPRDFVAEDGSVGPSYAAARRLCTFVSSFARVLSSAEPDSSAVVLSPGATAAPVADERTGARAASKPVSAGVSVEQLRGPAGSVAFILGDDVAKAAKPPVVLSLPNGLDLTVELGKSSAAWVLLDTHLHANQRLDFAAFCAFTLVGRTLVLFGPAGADGLVSINGTVVQLTAPRGKTPVVQLIDGTTVVLCNTAQIDAMRVRGDVVYVGAAGFRDDDDTDASHANDADAAPTPIAADGFKTVTAVEQEGTTRAVSGAAAASRSTPKARFTEWAVCPPDDLLTGESDRYARIDGPASLEALGTPNGYAWMRMTFKSKAAKRQSKVGFFHAADRLLVSLDGATPVIAGVGPGAPGHVVNLPLRKAEHTLVALVDNLGRFCEGMDMREPKGIFGPVHVVEPMKLSPDVVTVTPIDLLGYVAPLDHVHAGDTTNADRLTWSFKHLRKTPVVLHIAEIYWQGVVLLNGEPVAPIMPGRPLSAEFTNDQLKRGMNEVQIAVVGDNDQVNSAFASLKKLVTLYEATETLTDKATFAFAAWEPPKGARFEPVSKSAMSGAVGKDRRGFPTWWRASLDVADLETPVQLSMAGLSKGQLLVNGFNVSRYCVQTGDGKTIPPQLDYYIPPDVLREGDDNEVLIFDEHGFAPHRVTIKRGPLTA
jgi:hypothetical protein